MVQDVGSAESSELRQRRIRYHSIGEQLVSLVGSDLQRHSRSTGDVQATREIDPALMERVWPASGNVFYGEDGIYLAVEGSGANEIDIIRVPLVGALETLLTLRLQEDEKATVLNVKRNDRRPSEPGRTKVSDA